MCGLTPTWVIWRGHLCDSMTFLSHITLPYVCMLLQEYGITRDEKLLIGQCICTPLLRKILADFQRNAEEEEESTRLDSRWAQHWC